MNHGLGKTLVDELQKWGRDDVVLILKRHLSDGQLDLIVENLVSESKRLDPVRDLLVRCLRFLRERVKLVNKAPHYDEELDRLCSCAFHALNEDELEKQLHGITT